MVRADLHIHSRFSRATSKNLTVRNLASHAAVKGIHLIGTGDCTHPAWLKELENELVYNNNTGFYSLKNPLTEEDIFRECSLKLGKVPLQPQFVLQGEISCIYKKNGTVRKNHQLVYFPDFETAKKFNAKLAETGNLAADGRPMLGLDAKHLFDMVLRENNSYLIPAHIWTPWFSVFGSKSGFDSLEECFEDLTPELFTLETGLSSDPPMNRLLSCLDRFVLISNSDAHSGENLGREANIFHDMPDYQTLFDALKRRNDLFYGTVEFYPEEGKYFADGHRACGVCLTPEETKARSGLCPVCQKPLTVGVLYRVKELADRTEPVPCREQFESCIPLKEILAELCGVGAKSKKIHACYENLLKIFPSELEILQNVPIHTLAETDQKLARAILCMRQNQVTKQCGHDGEYGKISIFN